MKTSSSLFALTMSSTILFAPSLANAEGWSFQPRLNAGVMNYEYKQEDLVTVKTITQGSVELKESSLLEGVKRSDNLPYIGIGGTIFYDRFFFLDLYGLKTATGQQKDIDQYNNLYTTGPIGTEALLSRIHADSDIDRKEYAVAAGYNVFDNLALFAGYKMSKTEFDNTINENSQVVLISISGQSTTYPFKGSLKVDLEQKGPFIGATYGWNIMDKGVLSVNAALGFFDGTVKQDTRLEFLGSVTNQLPTAKLSGDVVGLTLGVSWRGNITDNLAYSLALSGYNYNYDSNNADGANFSESVINFGAGLSYRF